MSAQWENFIRGINRTALETERLPRLVDPDLERPGGVEDKRMRRQHDARRSQFRNEMRKPQRMSRLERFEVRILKGRPGPQEEQKRGEAA